MIQGLTSIFSNHFGRKWEMGLVVKMFLLAIFITLVCSGLFIISGETYSIAGLFIYASAIVFISVRFGLDEKRKPKWISFLNSMSILSIAQALLTFAFVKLPKSGEEVIFLFFILFLQNLIFGTICLRVCKKKTKKVKGKSDYIQVETT